MVFNKMLLLTLMALAAFQVRADDDGVITDWCKPCTRLIDDFTRALKTKKVQDVYIRTCNDIYLEYPEYNQKCQDHYNYVLPLIRDALNAGQNGAQICTTLGACGADSQADLRLKFDSMRKQHFRFQKDFNKLF